MNFESHDSGIVGHHSHSASPAWMYIPVFSSDCCGFGRLLRRGLLVLLLFLYSPFALFVKPLVLESELGFPVCTFPAATASPASV